MQQRLPGIPKLFHYITCVGSKDSPFIAFVDVSSDLHPEANGSLHQPSYHNLFFFCVIGHRKLRYVCSKQVGLNGVVVYLNGDVGSTDLDWLVAGFLVLCLAV